MIPCERCISYAICSSKGKTYCEELSKYLSKRSESKFSSLFFCNSLSFFKCDDISWFYNDDYTVKFVKDKSYIERIRIKQKILFRPKCFKFLIDMKFFLYQIAIKSFGMWRKIKNEMSM